MVLNHCLEDADRPGIKAILIYPMNALATDQAKRIAELVHGNGRLRGAVRAGLYIGESQKSKGGTASEMGAVEVITDRKALQKNPPDILLTSSDSVVSCSHHASAGRPSRHAEI